MLNDDFKNDLIAVLFHVGLHHQTLHMWFYDLVIFPSLICKRGLFKGLKMHQWGAELKNTRNLWSKCTTFVPRSHRDSNPQPMYY